MSQYHRENPDAPIKHEWFEGARQHAGVDPASGNDFSAVQNNDRELWRETSGDFYADSIHVTLDGKIGIQVGGSVLVMPLKRWFEAGMTPMPEKPLPLATENTVLNTESGLRVELLKAEDIHDDLQIDCDEFFGDG